MGRLKRITAEEWVGRVVGKYRIIRVTEEGINYSHQNIVEVACIDCGKVSIKKMSTIKSTAKRSCPGYDKCGELHKRHPGDKVGMWTLKTDMQRNIWMATCSLCNQDARVIFSAGTLGPCTCTRLNSKYGRRKPGTIKNGWELLSYTDKGFIVQKCTGCGIERIRQGTTFALTKCKCFGIDIAPDITGKQFGLLTAVRRVGQDKHRNAVWLFSCVCGGSVEKILLSFQNNPKKGVFSCGCARRWKFLIKYLQREKMRHETY